MPLPPFGAESTWQDEVEAIHAELFRKAVISVYDTAQIVGGEPRSVVSRRPARIQQQRTPTVATDAGQQLAKRAFLFEIELRADEAIKKDMLIRVHDGGRDKNLEIYGFTVTNSVNSSEAAVRTIETITELAILPRIP